MRRLPYILAVVLGITLSTSCTKDFLNDPKPGDGSITDDIIFSTKSGAENALTGIYWIFRSENYNGYSGASTGKGYLTNRGLQTTMFHFEMKGNNLLDIYGGTYYWGNEGTWVEGNYNRDAEGTRTAQIWDMFYKAINNANAIILNVPNVKDASEAEKKQLIAEAKVIRAYSYFWLARVYQKSYAQDPNAPAVPIYTVPANNAAEGAKRASMKDLYALIVNDMEDGIANLTNSRAEKYRINLNVANAVAALVYQELAMADASLWDKVISNAQAAVAGYPLMSNAQYQAGFNTISNPEWIWGFPVPSDQSLTYYSIYSFVDQNNGYYKNIYANVALYDSYSATDERRSLLIAGANDPIQYPLYQRYTDKFRSRTKGMMEGDILVMRAAEFVLIEAEAYAQKGLLSDAISKLYSLQVLRDPSAVKMDASSTKGQVIDAILVERSKELYGENGGLYFDYKRLQKDFVRTGNHPNKVNIPATDVRWVFKIPQKEMDANSSLVASDQNP